MSITTNNHRSGETISGSWQLDPQRSSVEFRVGLFWGLATVKGHFDDYQGQLDPSANPAIELTIDAASLQTGNRRRDRHLRSADFFDAEDHPRVQFVSDSVDLQGETLKVQGRLSARGRSVPIELDAQVRHGRRRARDRSGHHRAAARARDELEPARDDLAAQRAVRQGPPVPTADKAAA